MDNIIVLSSVWTFLLALYEFRSILNHRDMIRWQMEVLSREAVDDGVKLDNCRFDSVVY